MGDEGDAARPEAGIRSPRQESAWRIPAEKLPCTVETWQPTFSNTRPLVISAMTPPPPSRLGARPGRYARSERRACRLSARRTRRFILDRLEARANTIAQLLEPGAGARLPFCEMLRTPWAIVQLRFHSVRGLAEFNFRAALTQVSNVGVCANLPKRAAWTTGEADAKTGRKMPAKASGLATHAGSDASAQASFSAGCLWNLSFRLGVCNFKARSRSLRAQLANHDIPLDPAPNPTDESYRVATSC